MSGTHMNSNAVQFQVSGKPFRGPLLPRSSADHSSSALSIDVSDNAVIIDPWNTALTPHTPPPLPSPFPAHPAAAAAAATLASFAPHAPPHGLTRQDSLASDRHSVGTGATRITQMMSGTYTRSESIRGQALSEAYDALAASTAPQVVSPGRGKKIVETPLGQVEVMTPDPLYAAEVEEELAKGSYLQHASQFIKHAHLQAGMVHQEEKQRARARVRQYVSDRALEEAATRSHVRVQAHEQATLRDAALVVQRAWRAYYGKKVEERARRKEDLERRIQEHVIKIEEEFQAEQEVIKRQAAKANAVRMQEMNARMEQRIKEYVQHQQTAKDRSQRSYNMSPSSSMNHRGHEAPGSGEKEKQKTKTQTQAQTREPLTREVHEVAQPILPPRLQPRTAKQAEFAGNSGRITSFRIKGQSQAGAPPAQAQGSPGRGQGGQLSSPPARVGGSNSSSSLNLLGGGLVGQGSPSPKKSPLRPLPRASSSARELGALLGPGGVSDMASPPPQLLWPGLAMGLTVENGQAQPPAGAAEGAAGRGLPKLSDVNMSDKFDFNAMTTTAAIPSGPRASAPAKVGSRARIAYSPSPGTVPEIESTSPRPHGQPFFGSGGKGIAPLAHNSARNSRIFETSPAPDPSPLAGNSPLQIKSVTTPNKGPQVHGDPPYIGHPPILSLRGDKSAAEDSPSQPPKQHVHSPLLAPITHHRLTSAPGDSPGGAVSSPNSSSYSTNSQRHLNLAAEGLKTRQGGSTRALLGPLDRAAAAEKEPGLGSGGSKRALGVGPGAGTPQSQNLNQSLSPFGTGSPGLALSIVGTGGGPLGAASGASLSPGSALPPLATPAQPPGSQSGQPPANALASLRQQYGQGYTPRSINLSVGGNSPTTSSSGAANGAAYRDRPLKGDSQMHLQLHGLSFNGGISGTGVSDSGAGGVGFGSVSGFEPAAAAAAAPASPAGRSPSPSAAGRSPRHLRPED